ncbi:MAG TPA: hypothetical protein PLL66_07385 [Bacteroidales bacterium]|nr:hypothetical protein [Bacteroidales bacterium]
MAQNIKIPFLNQKFDPRTFLTIFKRNFWVMLIIGVVCLGVGLAYYRYTLPVFKSTSILQIKNENKTNQILGINSVVMENDLAPVIELIRSHEFLKTVVAALPLEVSYYRQGTFLSTELYGSTPFEIKYRLNNPVILDQKINCEFIDYKCNLSYEINGEIYEYRLNPEEWQSVFGMEILIHFPTKKDMEIELDPENKSQYYFTINDPNTVLYSISANLNIQILNETAGTILITYYDYNASKAAEITNTIAEKFIQFDENKKKESANNIVNYIDQQMENVFSQLNSTEKDLHDFRVQNNIRATSDNVLFNKANIYTSKITELENKLINVDFEIMTLEKISKKIESEPELKTYEILAMLSGQQSEKFLSEMINSLQELLSRKEVLLFDVTANNHKIKVIDEQIQSKKDIIVDFVNSTIIRLNGEKIEYDKRINEIESQVFVDSAYDEIEYAKLLRLYSINEDFYSQLIQTKAETMISQAGYVSANLILEKASVPAYPDYPALRKVFMLSVIIAFVISAMFILL